ncbi:coiled-coil domain-containing protein 83 isoform X2 [Mobula birostris]|uniref:coiled-coil domain-containing protein 83 isoform X2 n=1 Tax=Mobula birostris TaxID=1983395 RepID=UPI003B28A5DE
MAKKKKKGKRGGSEDKMNLAEAFLGFRFQVKETAIERFTNELKQLEEINARYREQNEQLKKEQKEHIKSLFKLAKEQEKELEHKELINTEQVEQAMKENFELIRQNEQQVQDMQTCIANVEQDILNVTEVKEHWLEYKNVGSVEHGKIIEFRENELLEMAKSFSEMEDHFSRTLERAKEETDKLAKKQMDEKKAIATQKAISCLGRHNRQEVKENEWLKKELKQYSMEIANIEQAVQKVEEENLEILSQLFDCQISDLNRCRNLIEICAVRPKDHDTGLLEGASTELYHRGETSEIDTNSNLPKPKSKTVPQVEKEISSMQLFSKKEKTESDEEMQFHLSKSVSQNLTYLLQEDEKFLEYLECGTFEQRMLHVKGQAMLLQATEQPTGQGRKNEQREPHEAELGWPVTSTMLRSVIS